jgi:hypothetical protein
MEDWNDVGIRGQIFILDFVATERRKDKRDRIKVRGEK